jgi:transcriptional regulator with XRE-family HTH domain
MAQRLSKTEFLAKERAADKHVGGRVQAVRVKRKMLIANLAELAEVDLTALGRYETGRRRMSPYVIFRLGLALDVPVKTLFEGVD